MDTENAKLRPPALNTIAGFVRLQRMMYGWKKQTLASQAGVSLSTVERVERGEAVRTPSLEKLAVALNQQPDAFTKPRVRLSKKEALKGLVNAMLPLLDTVPVKVAPLRTELQLRELATSELAIATSDIEDAKAEVDTIREWLDLTGFVRAQDGVTILPKRERGFQMRRLYRDVLNYVAEVEKQHRAVCLVGQYEAKGNLSGFETTKIGVIALRSRDHNPAAENIRQLFGPATVDTRAVFQSALEDD